MGKKEGLILLTILLLVIPITYSATELLQVGSCTASGCTVAGWNDLDNTADGSTLAPGGVDSLTLNDPTFSTSATINSVLVHLNHGGAGGIKGSLAIVFRNAANTVTYCTSTTPNTQGYTLSDITPTGCSWTYSRLQDLVVQISSGSDANKDEYNDFLNFTVDYTPYSDTTSPTITLGNPGPDTWATTTPITFYYTPSDTQSEIYNCSLIINGSINKTQTGGITKDVSNSISETLEDGTWNWTVNCTDTWNNTGQASTSKIINVDTQGPIINLETPDNNTEWTATQTVSFYFNASDKQRTLTSCELIIGGSVMDTLSSPSESTSLNFDYAPGNGQYWWNINCTDESGFETSSDLYNLTVNYAGRTVLTDAASYEQGSDVSISGTNWAPSSNITLIVTLSNGTIMSWNVTSDVSGNITDSCFINYSCPIGQYNVTAYEYLIPSNNATNSFTVTQRIASITVGSIFKQGETIEINGSGFSPNTDVNLNISFGTGDNTTIQVADSNGDFTYYFETAYISWTGLYNITAYDTNFMNLNATANFTLDQRLPRLNTTNFFYGSNEIVDIFGYNFSILAMIELVVFENDTGVYAPGYPQYPNANNSGDFYSWLNTTDTCPGIYGINAYDTNYSLYNETIYINLTGSTQLYNYTPNSTSGGTPGLVSNIQTKDDSNAESITLSATGLSYIYINFTNNIALDAEVVNAYLKINHMENDPSAKLNSVNIEIIYQGSWTNACNLIESGIYLYETCDLSGYLINGSDANNVQIRVAYDRSTGGTDPIGYIDYALMEVTAGGTGACTFWGNQPPSLLFIEVDDLYTGISNEIDLTVGGLTPVFCNITVYDGEGSSSILNAGATFYNSLNQSDDPDNNNTHYTNNDCTFISEDEGAKTKTFSCVFNITYYANNGTWICNATGYDTGGLLGSSIDQVNINELYAIGFTSNVTFPEIELGSTSSDVISTITNVGNVEIDLGIDGYATTDGDGIAMNCTEGNISFNDFRYDLLPAQNFDVMTPITDDLVNLTTFNLAKQTTAISNKNVYWKVRPSPFTAGTCQGIVVYTAMG